jgi:hypothetical protein
MKSGFSVDLPGRLSRPHRSVGSAHADSSGMMSMRTPCWQWPDSSASVNVRFASRNCRRVSSCIQRECSTASWLDSTGCPLQLTVSEKNRM